MIDPYRMVFINIITSIFLFGGVLIYKYIYPKKKINLFFLLLLISLLPLVSLLRPGDYESGDFNIHIHRIMSFYDALREGHIMPSWANELNGTYGIPVFVFNYSLPYYFIAFLHFIGFSFISSMKIFLGATFFFSGIFMYLWIKEVTNNKLSAFTASIFYLFSPYHLIDIHFRATPGESLVFTLIPLLFFFITKYFREKKIIWLILIILFTDLLFMAHPVLATIVFGICVLYVLLQYMDKKDLKISLLTLSSMFGGIIASIYVWAPFILYKEYVFKIPPGDGVGFYPFQLLFYSPWRYGFLFQGHYGELAQIIGYTQILLIITSLYLIFKKKISNKLKAPYVFWVILCIFIIFLMHPSSRFIWQYFPNLGSMMTPYGRLSLAITLCTSIIASYFVLSYSNTKTKKTIIYFVIGITIFSTILNWGHRTVLSKIGDKYLRDNAWISVQLTPHFMNPRWAPSPTYWFPTKPKASLEIIHGEAEIKLLKKETAKHTYIINAKTPVIIRENTLYFPNWSLKSNNNIINIYPGDKGIINAKLPKGLQYLELSYSDLPAYKLTKIISAVFFITLLVIIIILLIMNLRNNIKLVNKILSK